MQQGKPWGDWYKRPFDLTVLLLGHIAAFPVWLALWIAIPLVIKLEDRGSVFYTQVRVGRSGRLFRLFKFRTMIEGAEAKTGPVLAGHDDWRLTRVGRFMRAHYLDEIPQVINVWKGEMSLVGPRPERPELTEKITREIPGFTKRLRVRPGVAGLAQVRGSYSTSPRDKLRYDNLYIARMSPWLDIKLLFLQTLRGLRGSPN